MDQLLIEDYKLEIVNWLKDGSMVNLFAKWLIAELWSFCFLVFPIAKKITLTSLMAFH